MALVDTWAGVITSIASALAAILGVVLVVTARSNRRQLKPRNGRTIAQTTEHTADELAGLRDDIRDLLRSQAYLTRKVGTHLRQSRIDREALGLPPLEPDDDQEDP